MNMSHEHRPSRPAPDGPRKRPLEVVFASSPDGRLFELPADVADRYEFTEARAKELGDVPIVPLAPIAPDDEEVGGRHRIWLSDGTHRHHVDWLNGPYVWHRDGGSYQGPHWHPNPDSPFAKDMEDY